MPFAFREERNVDGAPPLTPHHYVVFATRRKPGARFDKGTSGPRSSRREIGRPGSSLESQARANEAPRDSPRGRRASESWQTSLPSCDSSVCLRKNRARGSRARRACLRNPGWAREKERPGDGQRHCDGEHGVPGRTSHASRVHPDSRHDARWAPRTRPPPGPESHGATICTP